MPDMNRMVEAACEAVLRASEVCRAVQRNLDRVRAITKDDRSPVTVADFASQAVVAEVLRRHLDEVGLVAEESSGFLRDPAHSLQLQAAVEAAHVTWPEVTAERLLDAIDVGAGHHADRGEEKCREVPSSGFWTLDPIDGTKGFLRGHQYAVCLAYIVGDVPVIGVLGCPNLPSDFRSPLDESDPAGCLYVSTRGGGLREAPCVLGEPLAWRQVSRRPYRPGDHITVCESFEPSHTKQDATARVLGLLAPTECRPPVRVDSQCKYALVSRGQADVYLRLPTKRGYVERIWDHASGALIAAETGCVVTDVRGVALDFSQGSGLEKNRGIVAAPAGLHGRIIEAIRRAELDREPV